MNNLKKELSFIKVLKGDPRSEELIDILTTLASYDTKGDDYIKLFNSWMPEDIKVQLLDDIYGKDKLKEEKAWKTIIDALSVEKIYKMIDKAQMCIRRCGYIENQISDIKKRLYQDSFEEILNYESE